MDSEVRPCRNSGKRPVKSRCTSTPSPERHLNALLVGSVQLLVPLGMVVKSVDRPYCPVIYLANTLGDASPCFSLASPPLSKHPWQLMGFALKSRPSLMISVAEYLEDKGEIEKAVQLYQKAGEMSRALDLCFRAGGVAANSGTGGLHEGGNPAMFEALKSMMDDLGSQASPQVKNRCSPGWRGLQGMNAANSIRLS